MMLVTIGVVKIYLVLCFIKNSLACSPVLIEYIARIFNLIIEYVGQ